MTQVFASGPVAITTTTGAHQVVPLSAMQTDPSGKIVINGWNGDTAAATSFANYLLSQGILTADPSLTPAPPGPPFYVKAVNPGAISNDDGSGHGIVIDITDVTDNTPSDYATMKMTVTVVNFYSNLSLADIADVIGTAPHGGSKPGLAFLVAPPPPPALTIVPGEDTYAFGGPQLQAEIKDDPPTQNAFVLQAAAPGGGGGTFEAEISNVSGNNFDLTITWTKSVTTAKRLSELKTDFAYVIDISPPPNAIYGVPKNNSQIKLTNGADPQSLTQPATPATGAAEPGP